MYNIKENLIGLFFTSGSRIAVILLGFITSTLIARELTPSDLGIYAILISVFGYLSVFCEFGLKSSCAALIGNKPEYSRSILNKSIKIRLGIYSLVAPLVLILTYLYKPDYLKDSFFVYLSVLFVIFINDWYLIAKNEYRKSSILSSSRWIFYFILVSCVGILKKLTITDISILYCLSWLLSAMFSIFVTQKQKDNGDLQYAESSKKILLTGFPVLLSALIGQIILSGDIIFAGLKYSAETVGYYNIALMIITAGLVFSNSFSQMALSKFSAVTESNIYGFLVKTILLLLCLGIFISVFIYFLSPYVIHCFFGDKYEISNDFIIYLLPFFVFQHGAATIFSAMVAIKMASTLFILNIIKLMVFSVSMLTLNTIYGFNGIPISKAIAELVFILSSMIIIYRNYSNVNVKNH